ncbi:MAG: transposase zinc-binding domain-containing protein [Acidobacteriia bacterium]|nr:transposase zinc-binding domain-containing protein [Terriglobia bacterium]
MQEHLLTFEQQWTDEASGRTLPKFVTDELHGFMSCGILGRGFAHLYCKSCREHHVVAFSCKARAVCPSCSRSSRPSSGAGPQTANGEPAAAGAGQEPDR